MNKHKSNVSPEMSVVLINIYSDKISKTNNISIYCSIHLYLQLV